MLAEHFRDYLIPNMDMGKYEKYVKECLEYTNKGLLYAKTEKQTVDLLFIRANYGRGVISNSERMNDYEQLVALEPKNTAYIESLAKLKRSFGRYNEALFLYDKIVEIESASEFRNIYDTYQAMGEIYLDMNSVELAIDTAIPG